MATTPFGPDVPPPLTERERRILAAIGEGLTAESPKLGRQLSAPARGPVRRRGGADDVICVVILLVVLAMVLPSTWFMVAVVVAAITVATLVAARRPSPGGAGADPAGDDSLGGPGR
jgi:hypothetical protein